MWGEDLSKSTNKDILVLKSCNCTSFIVDYIESDIFSIYIYINFVYCTKTKYQLTKHQYICTTNTIKRWFLSEIKRKFNRSYQYLKSPKVHVCWSYINLFSTSLKEFWDYDVSTFLGHIA